MKETKHLKFKSKSKKKLAKIEIKIKIFCSMINRFRFSKPMPQEQREKTRFWWNDESCGKFNLISYYFSISLYFLSRVF